MSVSNFKNVTLLSITQALVMSGTSLVGLVGALIGYELAPKLQLSTLPIVAVVLGNALNIAPCIWLIKKLGRKNASLVGIGLTVLSGLLASFALTQQHFYLFVASQGIFGMSISFVNQYRFAAAESVEKQDVPKAVSWILIGGLFAAFFGPQLAVQTRYLFAEEFSGSYLIFSIVALIAGAVLSFLKPTQTTQDVKSKSAVKGFYKHPDFVMAMLLGVLSYAMMTFLMTATPIVMNKLGPFSLVDTKTVLQLHIVCMFLPSFFTGPLIQKWGLHKVVGLGLVSYFVCIAIGQMEMTYSLYIIELMLLGLGWNFLFVSSTSLLARNETLSGLLPQALNDGCVFGAQACASLGAGVMVYALSWAQLNTVIGVLFVVVTCTYGAILFSTRN